MKFSSGIADFYKLRTEGLVYVDRTEHIRRIEDAGAQLLFLRPRRFGKSLLLSTLENYYDVAKADEFARLFGDLAIGKDPTPKRNQYFVLKWDFSAISLQGDSREMRQTLHRHLNAQIENFAERYQPWLKHEIKTDPANALNSFQSLLGAVKLTPHRLYLLIDEYDNFANELLMGGQPQAQSRFEAIWYGDGTLKTLFRTVKAGAAGWGLDRVFITGVAPFFWIDLIGGGYNVAQNISLFPRFQDLCGFTEAEIERSLNEVAASCGSPTSETARLLELIRPCYKGYCFSDDELAEPVYHPTLTLNFLKHYQEHCVPPPNMLEAAAELDNGKLKHIAALPDGAQVIAEALQDNPDLSVPLLESRFGIGELLTTPQGQMSVILLLYYLGALTQCGRTMWGEVSLRPPNLAVRELLSEHVKAEV